MAMLHWSILVRSISTRRANFISMVLEQLANLGVTIQFTSLVHMDILAMAVRRVLLEELLQPVERQGL